MHLFDVTLTDTYSKIAESISNFAWKQPKEFAGRKKQAFQFKKYESKQFNDKVVTFIDAKEKLVKHWRKKIQKQQYLLLKEEVEKQNNMMPAMQPKMN
jgi:hypothetical protein